MQLLYFDIDLTQKETYKTKNEPVNFLTSVLDSVHTAIAAKNYLAVKYTRKKNTDAKINDSMVMQDFFGALNY